LYFENYLKLFLIKMLITIKAQLRILDLKSALYDKFTM